MSHQIIAGVKHMNWEGGEALDSIQLTNNAYDIEIWQK
jgi:hypothetical protein